MSDKLPSSGRLRTREQQKAAKKKGDIRGFFCLPQGRPPNQTKEAAKRKAKKELSRPARGFEAGGKEEDSEFVSPIQRSLHQGCTS